MTPDELAQAGLVVDVAGPVVTVTLQRPEVRNAQTPAMWRALGTIGESLGDDVRVVVLRGAGPSFSAGLDRTMFDAAAGQQGVETLADLLKLADEEVSATIEVYQQGFTWLRDPRFVSVAAVRGYALGAGFQLALACDLRVVSHDARFSMKESALGLVPDLTGTKHLVECVGYARALEICATARMVEADEAVRIGLAMTAVPATMLDGTVTDLAGTLAAPMAGAVREIKALLQGVDCRSLDDQRRLEREAQVRRLRDLARLSAGG